MAKQKGGARKGAGRKSYAEHYRQWIKESNDLIATSLPEITRKGIEMALEGNEKLIQYYTDRAMGKVPTPLELEVAGKTDAQILAELINDPHIASAIEAVASGGEETGFDDPDAEE